MDYQTLNFDVDSGVATITLNRPEALNAMSPAMAKELHEVALQIDANNSVRAVILTGTGKAFCAGGDLGAFVAAGEQARTLILQMTGDLHLALSRLSRNRAPVIAAVNGTAAGAGFSLGHGSGSGHCRRAGRIHHGLYQCWAVARRQFDLLYAAQDR